MREDATIDRLQVRCPNASTIGYGKWKAQVGDLVMYREDAHIRTGRMIGRIHYAPPCGNSPAIKNWLLLVVIADNLRYTMERWINPADVIQIEAIRDQARILDYFLGADLTSAPIDEIRRSTTEGWSTLDAYRTNQALRAAEQADFERRHPKGECKCDICALID